MLHKSADSRCPYIALLMLCCNKKNNIKFFDNFVTFFDFSVTLILCFSRVSNIQTNWVFRWLASIRLATGSNSKSFVQLDYGFLVCNINILLVLSHLHSVFTLWGGGKIQNGSCEHRFITGWCSRQMLITMYYLVFYH